MELFKVNAIIEKKHSDKKDKDYYVITCPLSSDYDATFFPKEAEVAIIKRSDFLNNAKTDLDINNNTSNISNTSVFDQFG